MERKSDKDPVVPDITHLLYRHYCIGLRHKIREKAPLPDEIKSSQEGRSKSGKAKVKKGKGKPNKKHLIIKLVCDEDNNKSELLVYMRHDKYYIIAFGVPGGKTYIFSNFEGEIEGVTVLPYNSSYGIKLPDHSDKEHIEKVFKKYPKLCYFMLSMIWRGKQYSRRSLSETGLTKFYGACSLHSVFLTADVGWLGDVCSLVLMESILENVVVFVFHGWRQLMLVGPRKVCYVRLNSFRAAQYGIGLSSGPLCF
nr:hypothetical protein [Tanacetum cinerariifolium]